MSSDKVESKMESMTTEAMRALIAEHGDLRQVLRHYEALFVAAALKEHHGSITAAARELGLTHQGVAFILNGRHKQLQELRESLNGPRRRRCKSIIKIPVEPSRYFRRA